MSATLRILGCRAGAPGAGAAASGYLLQDNGITLLVDCGPGVALTLASMEPAPEIDAVIISHRHADHCADLLAIAYQRLFPQRHSPLALFGPPDLAITLNGLDQIFGMPSLPALAQPLRDAFAFYPVVPGSSFSAAGITVDTYAAHHPVPTLALRWPSLGLVYTADSALTEGLIIFAADAHVLLAEATYLSGAGHDLASHGHLTATQAGELGCQARVGQLILTHLADPSTAVVSCALASDSYSGPIRVAMPGAQIALT